jgi:transposase-like protein
VTGEGRRRFDDLKLLIIYIDGVVFGEHTMIGAVGVDTEGYKHVLGIREGATENSTVVTELLQDIVARGVEPYAAACAELLRPTPASVRCVP